MPDPLLRESRILLASTGDRDVVAYEADGLSAEGGREMEAEKSLTGPCGRCRVKAQSSGFTPEANRCERPLTCALVVFCCLLLSPRFRPSPAPMRPHGV